MELLTIKNVLGLGFGVFCVAVIVDALPNTGSAAYAQSRVVTDVSSTLSKLIPDANAPSSQSLSRLLRVGERTYEVSFDASISDQVTSTGTVRKIGFGKETLVTIVTTPSGTYSTDGFASPHVLYPGVSVAETTRSPDQFNIKILLNGEYVDWSAVVDAVSGA